MQQANLWLPGFEFADALLGGTFEPTKTFDAPVEVVNELKPTLPTLQTPAVAPLDMLDMAFVEDDAIASTESVRNICVSAQAAAVIKVDLPTPPWPQLGSSVHDGLKGQVTKFEANVEAIELLQALEATCAQPNHEQRQTLNRYTGWGGIKHPFDNFPGTDWI